MWSDHKLQNPELRTALLTACSSLPVLPTNSGKPVCAWAVGQAQRGPTSGAQ